MFSGGGSFLASGGRKTQTNLIPWTQKSFLWPFSCQGRLKLTSQHQIQRNSFQNRVCLCFLSSKHEKSYSVDPKILSLDLKIVLFVVFRPPGAKYDLLALNTNKFFQNHFFVCFLIRGVSFGLWRQKNSKKKPYPENPLLLFSGHQWPNMASQCSKRFFSKLVFCVF